MSALPATDFDLELDRAPCDVADAFFAAVGDGALRAAFRCDEALPAALLALLDVEPFLRGLDALDAVFLPVPFDTMNLLTLINR